MSGHPSTGSALQAEFRQVSPKLLNRNASAGETSCQYRHQLLFPVPGKQGLPGQGRSCTIGCLSFRGTSVSPAHSPSSSQKAQSTCQMRFPVRTTPSCSTEAVPGDPDLSSYRLRFTSTCIHGIPLCQ